MSAQRFGTTAALACLLCSHAPHAHAGAAPVFGPGTTHAVGRSPQRAEVADLDMDGALDLVTANASGGGGGDLSVLYGDGAGGFEPEVRLAAGGAPFAVSIGNLGVNPFPDLVIAQASGGMPGSVGVIVSLGSRQYTPVISHALPITPSSILLRDLDANALEDVAVTSSSSTVAYVMQGGGFGSLSVAQPFLVGGLQGAFDAGDIDGDGDLDLAMNVTQSDFVHFLRNQGDNSFEPPALFGNAGVDGSPRFLDFDLNGDLDFVFTNDSTQTQFPELKRPGVVLLFNDGNGDFSSSVEIESGMRTRSLDVGDLNGDGYPDLLVKQGETPRFLYFENDGAGSVLAAVELAVSAEATRSHTLADLDADGDLDLVLTREDTVVIHENVTAETCPGDCDGDGTVAFADLVAMLFVFGESDAGACDADGSGEVDFNDLVAGLFVFGGCG